MKNIDEVASFMSRCVSGDPRFPGLDTFILELAAAARLKCETLRTDQEIYDVWSNFVVAGESVTDFVPIVVPDDDKKRIDVLDAQHMLKEGVRLIGFITRARTPMPLSTKNFLNECERYKARVN